MRKNAELTMNVIIIAALGLLVLVILAAIFVGKIGSVRQDVDLCKGSCVKFKTDCAGQYQKITRGECNLDPSDKPSDNFLIEKNAADGYCCISAEGNN